MPGMNNVEKNAPKHAPFLNQNKNRVGKELKTAAGVLAGTWVLQRFPKIAMFGLIGVGVLIGLTMKEVARSVDRFPRRRREDLH